MGGVIEPFLLERYFAEHEFATPYLLCSSDLETVAMRDLVATADAGSAALWDDLRLISAKEKKSQRYLVLKAFKDAGYNIHDVDLFEDGRRAS